MPIIVVYIYSIYSYVKVDTIQMRQYRYDKRLNTYSFKLKSHTCTMADYSETLVQNILNNKLSTQMIQLNINFS